MFPCSVVILPACPRHPSRNIGLPQVGSAKAVTEVSQSTTVAVGFFVSPRARDIPGAWQGGNDRMRVTAWGPTSLTTADLWQRGSLLLAPDYVQPLPQIRELARMVDEPFSQEFRPICHFRHMPWSAAFQLSTHHRLDVELVRKRDRGVLEWRAK
nr:hypothetical protein GCM10017611_51990 [Rhodococcus wratislaviensis]